MLRSELPRESDLAPPNAAGRHAKGIRLDFITLTTCGMETFSFPPRGRLPEVGGTARLFSLTFFLSLTVLLQSLNTLSYFEVFD